ncbi:Mitochondrial DNA replication protein yhm2 [Cyanidiococcus yangmingshanensis]|uniref:Mitochondrial DNA replication protein yhm2 n=1 Tax=Cyanidiococcus yangmingshanensis TaxID=2690220 RepID=A0A7J7IN33_9RHOD|nr:Mitochondrial DNA replication protein yhm2 [Cyanidiococcus yangmingshanensis]
MPELGTLRSVQATDADAVTLQAKRPVRKPIDWTNLGLGAALQLFEVTTLGQPFEVIKTHLAANRTDSLFDAFRKLHARGGLAAFWTGLIPWAWIEAATKGAVLLLTQSETTFYAQNLIGLSPGWAAAVGGMAGGVCQAYTTMGFCTFMKTVEVTRARTGPGSDVSTWQVARDILKRDGVAGMYRGVNAVALRQLTNWGSRFGLSRATEWCFRRNDPERALTVSERLASSVVGGALACWNQPIEVIRVEMQSAMKRDDWPASRTVNMWNVAKWIYQRNGVRGFYRGVTPRIGLSVYLTSVMVFGGDQLKERVAARREARRLQPKSGASSPTPT